MISLLDVIAKGGKKEDIPTTKTKEKILTDRRYDVIGYRLNGETITPNDYVGLTKARNLRKEYRRAGCHRVDILEVSTKAKGKELTFEDQTFDPANEKFVPAPIEPVVKENIQTTFPWELVDNGKDAFLWNRPIVKVADRNAKNKAERKRTEYFNKINAKVNENKNEDKVMIYRKFTVDQDGIVDKANILLFSGNSNDATKYLMMSEWSIKELVIYLPKNLYERLVK